MKKTMITVMLSTLIILGCAPNTSNTQKGAGIGAMLGSLAGKGTGDNDKKRYVWGAILGALAGCAIGSYMDKQEEAFREELADSGVEV
jgi:outer membrane lipoprotein SlyB